MWVGQYVILVASAFADGGCRELEWTRPIGLSIPSDLGVGAEEFREMLRNSSTQPDDAALLRVASALDKRDLRIVSLGGSVTMGVGCPTTTGAGYEGTLPVKERSVPRAVPKSLQDEHACAWPAQLQVLLRQLFPGRRHTVTNHGNHGVSIQFGANLMSTDSVARGADLLLLNYDINDAGETPEEIQFATERVVRAARARDQALLFVHMCSNSKKLSASDEQRAWVRASASPPSRLCAVVQDIKADVLAGYGVPAVSYTDFVWKRAGDNPKTLFGLTGAVHPPWSFHTLLAWLVAHRLADAHTAASCHPSTAGNAVAAKTPARPLFAGDHPACEEFGTTLSGIGCNFPGCAAGARSLFRPRDEKNLGSWRFWQYVERKDHGWINSESKYGKAKKTGKPLPFVVPAKNDRGRAGSQIRFVLDDCFGAVNNVTTISVGFLKSYEGMGSVAVHARAKGGEFVPLGILDGMWHNKFSLFYELSFELYELSDSENEGHARQLTRLSQSTRSAGARQLTQTWRARPVAHAAGTSESQNHTADTLRNSSQEQKLSQSQTPVAIGPLGEKEVEVSLTTRDSSKFKLLTMSCCRSSPAPSAVPSA